ncbi:spore cortex biosynthesis protein YabQ [Eubacteriales bacterium OttesenSCG-928-K08]|nr:spore cortex biosynthesis protein YabQ [Eubacteriales bacterium OttesenSCG-928-K08]
MSNTILQPASFLMMLYGGAIAGIVYDALRLPRRLFAKGWIDFVCDLLFVLLALGICIISLLYASGGSLRPYLALAFISGFFVEQWSLSFLIFQFVYAIRSKLLKN